MNLLVFNRTIAGFLMGYGLICVVSMPAMEGPEKSLAQLVKDKKIDAVKNKLTQWGEESRGLSGAQIEELRDAFEVAESAEDTPITALIFDALIRYDAPQDALQLIDKWAKQTGINPFQLAVLRNILKSSIENKNTEVFWNIINAFRLPDIYYDAFEEVIRSTPPKVLEAFRKQLESATLIQQLPERQVRAMPEQERKRIINLLSAVRSPEDLTHRQFRRLVSSFTSNDIIPLIFSLFFLQTRRQTSSFEQR